MKKEIAIITISLSFVVALFAQGDVTGYYVKGVALFKKQQYFEAIQYFEQYLSTPNTDVTRSQPFAVQKKKAGKSNLNIQNEITYLLAESYRHLNHYSKAEEWYAKAMELPTEAYPVCEYWYAVILRANGKYDEAYKHLTAFRSRYTKMDSHLTGADLELKNLDFIADALNQTPVFTVERGKDTGYDYSTIRQNHQLYTDIVKAEPINKNSTDFYRTAAVILSPEGESPKELRWRNESAHYGNATISKDGKHLLLTGWTEKNGVKSAGIYKSSISDTGWTKPTLLPEPINIPNSNSGYPYITEDGKYLLFSSDRPGGTGKMDIWFAPIDEKHHALRVINAGNIVNTPHDEISPIFHAGDRTLIFASNGHIGMGGFDIFASDGDFQLQNWGKPYNPGSPINSSRDDLSFISNDPENVWNKGWLSSDRNTDCCLENFDFVQHNHQFVSGMVIDCKTEQPVEGVNLVIRDVQTSTILHQLRTPPNGSFSFKMQNVSSFEISTDKQGYEPLSSSTVIHFKSLNDSLIDQNVCIHQEMRHFERGEIDGILESISQPTPLANFPFNKSAISGISSHQLDSLVAIMKQYPDIVIEVGGHTDSKGAESYNLELAQRRVNSCIQYLVKRGIERHRLVGKAYGECCPLEEETVDGKDNPAARQKNRRVEYKLVPQNNEDVDEQED